MVGRPSLFLPHGSTSVYNFILHIYISYTYYTILGGWDILSVKRKAVQRTIFPQVRIVDIYSHSLI